MVRSLSARTCCAMSLLAGSLESTWTRLIGSVRFPLSCAEPIDGTGAADGRRSFGDSEIGRRFIREVARRELPRPVP